MDVLSLGQYLLRHIFVSNLAGQFLDQVLETDRYFLLLVLHALYFSQGFFGLLSDYALFCGFFNLFLQGLMKTSVAFYYCLLFPLCLCEQVKHVELLKVGAGFDDIVAKVLAS
jgi:hypothetical protein